MKVFRNRNVYAVCGFPIPSPTVKLPDSVDIKCPPCGDLIDPSHNLQERANYGKPLASYKRPKPDPWYTQELYALLISVSVGLALIFIPDFVLDAGRLSTLIPRGVLDVAAWYSFVAFCGVWAWCPAIYKDLVSQQRWKSA